MRQTLLDQSRPESFARRRPDGGAPHFGPGQTQLPRSIGAVDAPRHLNATRRCRQGAVFGGIGSELVQCQAERQSDPRLQPDLLSIGDARGYFSSQYGASSKCTTSLRVTGRHAALVKRSWVFDSATIRVRKACRNSCGEGAPLSVCSAIDITVASVFLTR
jgi:hypothetical protein